MHDPIRRAICITMSLLCIVVSRQTCASLDTEPYVYDPTFNNGHVIDDRFAAATTENQQLAQRLVRLDNGDVVVAGLVPAAFQANQTNGLFNVGLARYGSDGSRVPWSEPTPAFSYFNNMYVDYPNNSQAEFSGIRDIKAIGGFIYVLVDATTFAGHQKVSILAFSESGALVDDYMVLGTSLNGTGAGLATYYRPNCNGFFSCPTIVAIATYALPSGRLAIIARRFKVSTPPTWLPFGTLSVDTLFGPFANGANDYSMPDFACAGHSQCSVRAVGVTAVREESGLPTLYVGAESLWSNGDADAVVLAIDGDSGDAITSFGNVGFSWNPIDAGSSNNDVTVDVVAQSGGNDPSADRIYTVSEVALPCPGSTGIGVVKLLGGSGATDPSFGNSGELVFGGDSNPSCDSILASSDSPFAAALDDARLVVVGEQGAAAATSPPRAPLLSVVHAADGVVAGIYTQRPTRPDGTRWDTLHLRDVAVDGDGSFTSVGYLIDEDPTKPLFGTTRFRSDRIFGDGLD